MTIAPETGRLFYDNHVVAFLRLERTTDDPSREVIRELITKYRWEKHGRLPDTPPILYAPA